MSLQRFIEDVIQSRKRSIPAVLIRILFFPLSLVYACIMFCRNLMYDLSILPVRRAGIPVISVGNITVGGTGKTPVAILLIEHFLKQNKKVALLARSYGVKQGYNDELIMIHERFPDIIIEPGSDRIAHARTAVHKGAQIIILDDGFQHRRIHRDCNILTLDASQTGFPHLCIPSGPFREPWTGRKRADIILLTKCRTEETASFAKIPARNDQTILRTIHKPVMLTRGDIEKPLEFIAGKKVFLFCGIADPYFFKETAEQTETEITGSMFFPDHHFYSEQDIDSITYASIDTGAEVALTTEKDMAKISQMVKNGKNNIEFLALSITIGFLDNSKSLWDTIHERIKM
jgi:tetraacyldisaccharide 4'-kinase